MKVKKSSVGTNVIMVSVTLLAAFLLLSGEGKAEEGMFKSQGKIVFDNGTQDTADDVVFDSADFNRLAYTCR